MRILCTFPGRYGDLLWALPTIRALSRRIGTPVDLQIAGEFAGIVPLLEQQPYLGAVGADPRWAMSPPNEWMAPFCVDTQGQQYQYVFHLGYHGWPQQGLPFEVLANLSREHGTVFTQAELDLQTPWITVPDPLQNVGTIVGFTEAWFELKLGLILSIARRYPDWLTQITPCGSRWTTEVPPGVDVAVHATNDWLNIADCIAGSDLFFGDCSALHVLAVAMGKRTVICEPMEARHNPIFYPLGWDGPQVTIVKGNDGRPTFDARHCKDALEAAYVQAH